MAGRHVVQGSNSRATLDFDLARGADLIRDQVRGFAKREIAPWAAAVDRDNAFPADLWTKMSDLGLLGITVVEDFAGAGLGYLHHVVAMEELSRASASMGLSYGAHSNLCVNQTHRNGSDGQKRRFLGQLVSGSHVGVLAMSGSDAG